MIYAGHTYFFKGLNSFQRLTFLLDRILGCSPGPQLLFAYPGTLWECAIYMENSSSEKQLQTILCNSYVCYSSCMHGRSVFNYSFTDGKGKVKLKLCLLLLSFYFCHKNLLFLKILRSQACCFIKIINESLKTHSKIVDMIFYLVHSLFCRKLK